MAYDRTAGLGWSYFFAGLISVLFGIGLIYVATCNLWTWLRIVAGLLGALSLLSGLRGLWRMAAIRSGWATPMGRRDDEP